jgi:ribosomal protein L10
MDGAYNIRYEVIKKRIDKALIKGTDERKTRQGRIAIVYSKEEEETEYKLYLEFLRKAGIIGNKIEKLDVEDLQGVSGLKALRVSFKGTISSYENLHA